MVKKSTEKLFKTAVDYLCTKLAYEFSYAFLLDSKLYHLGTIQENLYRLRKISNFFPDNQLKSLIKDA